MFNIFKKKKIEEQCEPLILGSSGSGMVRKIVIPIPEEDYKVIDIIENKIESTNGAEQKEWVRKYDMFTSRNLFNQYNQLEKLEEVDRIRKEVLAGEQ